jgi:signal transduction histidine kinase
MQQVTPMLKLRMRTKFLLSMLLISAGLTCTSLLLVRHSVQSHVRREIFADLRNSVSTFQNFQRERELTLTHSAELLADLPNLRALMTTQHEATIQDASVGLWQLAGSDLFVLADRSGRVMALHTASPGLTREMAQKALVSTVGDESSGHWWFGGQHLYEVFLRPIYFGPAEENHLLGFLAIGYEIDDRVSSQIGRIAASEVAFYYGNSVVKTTLTPVQESELARQHILPPASGATGPEEIQLGDERFLITSLELSGADNSSVRLSVLKSYDQATVFLDSLNRLLLALGLAAVLGGSALVFFISHTFTRPLGSLVNGVRALERGDFNYVLDARGGDEVAELTRAFKRTRDSLRKTQQDLLEAERLATIGRMASSISHDLRHSLAAIVANAEFLCESKLSADQREDLYREVRVAVNQMTDLIDSLLEFSRTRESLRTTCGNVKESVDRVVGAIRTHPEFHPVHVTVSQQGSASGCFDQRKLERVLYNLMLNACEAVVPEAGRIHVDLKEVRGGVEIRVSDNGHGIPELIRGQLFEPFISHGKENGTGLGLTVVQKIVQDHGGDVIVEKTSREGTVFRVLLPLAPSPETEQPGRPPMARTGQSQSE